MCCRSEIVVSLVSSGVTFNTGAGRDSSMSRSCRGCQTICWIADPCSCTLCREGICPKCKATGKGDDLDRIRHEFFETRRSQDD